MKHILREITKLTKQTFPRGIEIRSDVANDLWLIKADPTQVDQVLMNLLVNARDAMETGGRLTLTAENIFVEDKVVPGQPQSVSGRHVLITVSDTGCGIPPATVGRIFEPFYTTKKTGAGTGLGLATVATILKGHNAFIEVQSNVGEGTTFKVYFPAVQETAASETRPAVSEVPRGNGECVLLVDDEQAFVEMSRALLESFNYRTLSAFNGADALRIYRENADKIAVLVTDSLMPNVSGSALIGEVRRINPRIPIIITTGLGSEEALEKVKGLGVSAILCKPFKPDDLLLTIRQNIANG